MLVGHSGKETQALHLQCIRRPSIHPLVKMSSSAPRQLHLLHCQLQWLLQQQ